MIEERHPDHEESLAGGQAPSEAPLSAEVALDRVLSTLDSPERTFKQPLALCHQIYSPLA